MEKIRLVIYGIKKTREQMQFVARYRTDMGPSQSLVQWIVAPPSTEVKWSECKVRNRYKEINKN
jgi:hypothetical protein